MLDGLGSGGIEYFLVGGYPVRCNEVLGCFEIDLIAADLAVEFVLKSVFFMSVPV